MPDRWTIEPPQKNFQLSPGEQLDFPFEVRLKNALYGVQPIRIEFNVEADEPYQFTVYRHMNVGTRDLTLEVDTHIDRHGILVVEQFMQNKSGRVADFRCSLYARGRRLQRAQVYRLGESLDRKVYRYPDGEAIVGQELLLEIEELSGPRVLKFRFLASAQSQRSASDRTEEDHDLQNVDSSHPVKGSVSRSTADTTSSG
jgi:hypothetical protein